MGVLVLVPGGTDVTRPIEATRSRFVARGRGSLAVYSSCPTVDEPTAYRLDVWADEANLSTLFWQLPEGHARSQLCGRAEFRNDLSLQRRLCRPVASDWRGNRWTETQCHRCHRRRLCHCD